MPNHADPDRAPSGPEPVRLAAEAPDASARRLQERSW
jgi:hypothetical protein